MRSRTKALRASAVMPSFCAASSKDRKAMVRDPLAVAGTTMPLNGTIPPQAQPNLNHYSKLPQVQRDASLSGMLNPGIRDDYTTS